MSSQVSRGSAGEYQAPSGICYGVEDSATDCRLSERRGWDSVAVFHSVTPGQQGTDSVMPLPGRLGGGIASLQQPLCTHFGSHGDRALDNVTVISDYSQYNCWHQHSALWLGHSLSVRMGRVACQSPKMQDCRQKMPAQQKGLLLRSKLGRD